MSELTIHVFTQDMVTAFKMNEIPLDCFKLETKAVEHPPGAPNQGHWTNCRLFLDPDRVLNALAL